MAIDGSFSVEYELQRFLLRCPKLAAAPQLDNLVKKVLRSSSFLQGPFLHVALLSHLILGFFIYAIYRGKF